jgi:hypothetical protein
VTNVVKTATTVVKEDEVIHYTCCRRGRVSHAGLDIAPLVHVVGLTLCAKVLRRAKEIVANVRDVFLQERQEWIWISDICSDTQRIFVTVSQARFFRLGT